MLSKWYNVCVFSCWVADTGLVDDNTCCRQQTVTVMKHNHVTCILHIKCRQLNTYCLLSMVTYTFSFVLTLHRTMIHNLQYMLRIQNWKRRSSCLTTIKTVKSQVVNWEQPWDQLVWIRQKASSRRWSMMLMPVSSYIQLSMFITYWLERSYVIGQACVIFNMLLKCIYSSTIGPLQLVIFDVSAIIPDEPVAFEFDHPGVWT